MTWANLLNWDSPTSSESAYSYSPISTPSPGLVSGSRPPAPSPPFVRSCHVSVQTPRTFAFNCGCLSEPACYNTAVELASELRRAAEIMDRSLDHCFGPPCALSMKISELEALTRSVSETHSICITLYSILTDQKCPPERPYLSRCTGNLAGSCTSPWRKA